MFESLHDDCHIYQIIHGYGMDPRFVRFVFIPTWGKFALYGAHHVTKGSHRACHRLAAGFPACYYAPNDVWDAWFGMKFY